MALLNAQTLEEAQAPVGATLLELVTAMDADSENEGETTRRVLEALDSGRAYLTGNFRGQRIVLD